MNRPSPQPDERNIVSLWRRDNEPIEDRRPVEQDRAAGLRRTYAALLRRWFIVAPTALIVFAALYANAVLSPRIYAATALVMVNPAREQVLPRSQMIEDAAPTPSAVDSEIEVLRSPMLMRRVVEAMNLDRDPEWNGALAPPSGLSLVLGPLQASLSSLSGQEEGEGAAAGAEAREDLRAAVARTLGEAVTVRQRGLSYGISVTVESKSPARAAEIANRLVQIYLQFQTEARFEAAQRANSWLAQRLSELRQEVTEKERAAEAFRIRNGLSTAAGGDASQPQSDEMQTMLVGARADLAEKQAKLRQVEELMRQGGSQESIADTLSSPEISQLRTQAGGQERRLAELRQRYSDEHPDVIAAITELENSRQQIRAEAQRIVASLRNDVEVARARLGTLQGSFGSVGGVRGEENSDAIIQYRELVRQAAAAREVHESFLQRFHEVANQGDLPIASSRLVSDATKPQVPVKPNLRSAFLQALLLGLLAGIGLGLLFDLLDRTMSDAEDVERKLAVPALASVPMLREADMKDLPPMRQNPVDYLAAKPMSGFAEAFRVLRSSIMHSRIDQKLQVVAITSAIPREGKTTISLGLARVAAMAGQKVVLVDCDLRHPAVSTFLGADRPGGLFEVLTGELDWRGALLQDPETQARFLPTVASRFSPRDVFSSQAMQRLVAELRSEFELVIFDCAPVLAVAETRTLVTHADAVVMVARSAKTPATAARSALREIESAGGEVLGVALNWLDVHSFSRRGYGNALYYYAAQKYYRS